MNIVLSSELEKLILSEISNCQSDVNIVTAFCKLNTLQLIDSHIKSDYNIRKRLLVRFLPSDISSGATDKEIYNYCKQNGWKMYIDFSIHAKTYIFDKMKCILGSANLTNRGIGISQNSNKELSSYFEIDDQDYNKILSLYSDADVLDDELYSFIINNVDDNVVISNRKQLSVRKRINCLLPEDFPDENTDVVELYSLRAYKWLVSYLSSKSDKFAFFGELTANIHDIFVKEPKPYRKDIKNYLENLLTAIKRLNINKLIIDRPNFSERIRLDLGEEHLEA